MRGTLRSVVGANAIALLVTTGVVTVTAQPASPQTPQTPTVVVTPGAVAGGDPVQVEFSGFPEGSSAPGISTFVLLCPADVVGATTHPTSCTGRKFSDEHLASGSLEFRPSGNAGYDEGGCATVEGGCVIGVVQQANYNEIVAQAWDSISFYPTLRNYPLTYLADGDTVTVTGKLMPPGEWELAQCSRAYLDDPTPARAAQLCGPSVTVSAAEYAKFTADLVVHDPLAPTAPGEARIPCGTEGCTVVIGNESVPVADTRDMSFETPLTATVTASYPLADVATVKVTVEGWPVERGQAAWVAQCVTGPYPTPTNITDAACGQARLMGIDESGSGNSTLEVRSFFPVPRLEGPSNWFVQCGAGILPISCGVVLYDLTGERVVTASPSLGFSPLLEITPQWHLVDRETMTVAASDLSPGQYRLDYCDTPRTPTGGFACGQGPLVAVGADGVLDVEVPAKHHFTSTAGTHHVCVAAECMLRLWSVGESSYVAQESYFMSPGALTVTPESGLSDGQAVEVTGGQLMSSYSGPTFGGFPSGQWYLVQCNRNVGSFPMPYGWTAEQFMWGLLLNCSVYPPATPVTLPGSTLQTTLNVRASITNIVGETTDCTAAPRACVAGLVRLEQDGGLTTHLRPLTFES